MEEAKPVEIWEMIRMVAATRIIMPETQVRLSAGRMNMVKVRRCAFCWCKFYFFWRQIIDYPNPDVNDDMKMFEMLGLPTKPFTKVSQTPTVEAADSQFTSLEKSQNGQSRSHY
jgi:biotin synthase